MPKIIFKHGSKSTLPKLDFREPGITDDTEEIFVGGNTQNIQLAKQTDLDTANTNIGQKSDKTYVDTKTGDLTGLQTSHTDNLVNAINDNVVSLTLKANQTDLNNVQKFKLTQDTGLPFDFSNDATKLIDTLKTTGFYYIDNTNISPDPYGVNQQYTLQVGAFWNNTIIYQMLVPYQWINNADNFIFYRNIKNGDKNWTAWRALEFTSRSIYLEQNYNDMYNKVIALQNQYTKSIGFITDSHYIRNAAPPYGVNGKQHVKNIANFSKFGAMDLVIHGGDLINGKTVPTTYKAELYDMVKEMLEIKVPRVALIGNHDYGGWYNNSLSSPLLTNEMSPVERYTRITKPFMKDFVTDLSNPTGAYFYKDFDDIKLRVICLNTADNPWLANADGSPKYPSYSTHTIGNAQLNWLVNSALNFSGKSDATNWNVITFSHVPLYWSDSTSPVHNGYAAHGILKAFKNHTSYTPTPNTGDFAFSVTCDFTGGTGRHIGHIAGHYHLDQNFVYDSIQYIACLFSASGNVANGAPTSDTHDRTEGTVNEDCWNVFTVDTNARKLYLSRFGAGTEFETTINY